METPLNNASTEELAERNIIRKTLLLPMGIAARLERTALNERITETQIVIEALEARLGGRR